MSKEGINLVKDIKRECVQKFLNFLYQLREKEDKGVKKEGEDIRHQKLGILINKIIGDLEELSQFYEN